MLVALDTRRQTLNLTVDESLPGSPFDSSLAFRRCSTSSRKFGGSTSARGTGNPPSSPIIDCKNLQGTLFLAVGEYPLHRPWSFCNRFRGGGGDRVIINATDMYRAQTALPIGVSCQGILPWPGYQQPEREREPRSGITGVNHGPGILPRTRPPRSKGGRSYHTVFNGLGGLWSSAVFATRLWISTPYSSEGDGAVGSISLGSRTLADIEGLDGTDGSSN